MAFPITTSQLQSLVELIPDSLKTTTINEFILNKYRLPSNENELNHYINTEENCTEMYNVRLKQETLKKLEEISERISRIVEQIAPDTFISRSSVLRDVLEQMIQYYTQNPLTKPVKKTDYVEFDPSDIVKLDKYIKHPKERSKLINEFIQVDYKPENVIRTTVSNGVGFSLSMNVDELARIKEIAKEYRVTKTDVYRHIVKALIIQLEEEHKQYITMEMESIVREYQELGYGEELEMVINKLKNEK